MEDAQLAVKAENENQDHSVRVPEPPKLCLRVCTRPLSELKRITVADLRVGEPANSFYLLLRTVEPTITGAINFEFGPNHFVPVEDHDKKRTIFCLHAHVHLKSETELASLLPVDTVFVLKEPFLVACSEQQFMVVVGSPSDFVLVGRSHVMYKDAEALGWRQKLVDDGQDDWALRWKKIGDALFGKRDFDEAVDVYLFALTIGGDNVTNLSINQNLAQVFLELGYYERAVKHCHKVLKSVPINQTCLYLCGRAEYELRQFKKAKIYFQSLLTISPSNEMAAAELVRCEERLREAEGNVDILKLFRACQTGNTTPIDHENSLRNIAFRLDPDNERGVYATQDLVPGTLIFVEKPIVVILMPHSPSERGHVDFMRTAFRAVMKNPMSVGQGLYNLPGGGTLTEEKKRIFCDEVNELEPILDVPQLYQLIKRNILKTENSMVQNPLHSYQVYEAASQFRHSCLSNCSVVIYKDVITIRTSKHVSKGENLFVRFNGNNLSFRKKQDIFERMCFACSCDLCALDKMNSTEVHDMREELKTKFYKQIALCASSPHTAELNLLPIVKQLELTYRDRNSLRSLLFFVYCDLARVVDRSSEDWKSMVELYVATGLSSVSLSIDFLLSLPDDVNPQIPQWVLMPEVLFEYAALMAEIEFWSGRYELIEKWMNVLLVLERVYTGGNVEMLMQRFRGSMMIKSMLSVHAKHAVHS